MDGFHCDDFAFFQIKWGLVQENFDLLLIQWLKNLEKNQNLGHCRKTFSQISETFLQLEYRLILRSCDCDCLLLF